MADKMRSPSMSSFQSRASSSRHEVAESGQKVKVADARREVFETGQRRVTDEDIEMTDKVAELDKIKTKEDGGNAPSDPKSATQSSKTAARHEKNDHTKAENIEIQNLQSKLQMAKDQGARTRRILQKQLDNAGIDLNQKLLASKKFIEVQKEEIATLKSKFAEVKELLKVAQAQLEAQAQAHRKEVTAIQTGAPVLSNKEVYAGLKKERDNYHYLLVMATEELSDLKNKGKRSTTAGASTAGVSTAGVSTLGVSASGVSTAGALAAGVSASGASTVGSSISIKKEGSTRSSRPSMYTVSAPHIERLAVSIPSTPPLQTSRKPSVELTKSSTAISPSSGTTAEVSKPRLTSRTPSRNSGNRQSIEGQRIAVNSGRTTTGFQQIQAGLAKVDSLTEAQLEELREGLKLKMIMVAGVGRHIVGPFVRRNPGHREYVVEEDDLYGDA